MELPAETQSLITNLLEMVRRDSQHHLSPSDRYIIYESLSPARFDFPQYETVQILGDHNEFLKNQFLNSGVGDYTLYWLAILTLERILTRADQEEASVRRETAHLDSAYEILQVAYEVLLNKIDFIEAHHKLLSDFWFFTDSYVDYYSCLKYSAILALSVIMYCDETGLGTQQYTYSDETPHEIGMDYASEAVKAYTIIDKNKGKDVFGKNRANPIEFDAQKRLEFWEWWLTEAIPQAWELASN